MSTAGYNTATKDTKVSPNQGIGTRGIPEDAVSADEEGKTTVTISKDVADRFEQAKEHYGRQGGGGRSHILDDEKHKSGFEQAADRARNLTAVTKEKAKPGGDERGSTRRPEVGFPARPNVD
jgi:hypothetical protein